MSGQTFTRDSGEPGFQSPQAESTHSETGQTSPTLQAIWNCSLPAESVSPGEALPQTIFRPLLPKPSYFKTILNLLCLMVLAVGSYLGVSRYLVQSVRV